MIIGIALVVFGGAMIYIDGDWVTGLCVIVMGAMIIWTFADTARHRDIDNSVNNKIIATGGEGRYLVQAKTSRQITGPRPHTVENLPAHLTQVRKGLWIVDRNISTVSAPGEPQKSITWKPASGHIEPRGNGHSGGFLRDIVEGFEHQYIVGDDENE